MFLCDQCNVQIDCSFVQHKWNPHTGAMDITWSDCPEQCEKICRQSPIPQFQDWSFYDNLLTVPPLSYQPTSTYVQYMPMNWNYVSSSSASIGSVTDNFFRLT